MAILAAVGDTLVDLNALDKAAKAPGLDDFLTSSSFDPGFELIVSNHLTLTGNDLKSSHDAESEVVPFEGVGVGKPLTLMLEQVYLGDYPDTFRWLPGDQRGDVLVTSANKTLIEFDAAPRAIHLMETNAERRTKLRAKATQKGSMLIFHSPAVTDDSILFTFELSVDRQVNEKLGAQLGAAFTTAGKLPVFAPAAPFLIAAGIAIPLATEAVGLLANPSTFFDVTHELAFQRPGLRKFQAGAFVSVPDNSLDTFQDFKLDSDGYVLRDGNGDEYAGEVPYLVLSADGTDQPEYKEWAAQALSAGLVERYFGGQSALTSAIGIANKSMELYNDMHYQKKAAETKKQADAITNDPKAKAELMKRYQTYKKNVQSAELQSTLS